MGNVKCNVCGSTDVIETEDGLVCHTCGAHISLSETSDKEDAYSDDSIKLAQEALVSKNYHDVERYCARALDSDPENANAYELLGMMEIERKGSDYIHKAGDNFQKALQYSDKKDEESLKVKYGSLIEKQFFDTLREAFALIEVNTTQQTVTNAVVTRTNLAWESCVYEHIFTVTDPYLKKEYVKLIKQTVSNIYPKLLSSIHYPVGSELSELSIEILKTQFTNAMFAPILLGQAASTLKDMGDTDQELAVRKEAVNEFVAIARAAHADVTSNASEHVSRIKELDASYTAPTLNYLSTGVGSAGGGCYIATAIYGSYDCPQVWTLRRYRDYDLAQTWYGRLFIHTYYSASPTLVKWFGNKKWFRVLFRGRLDRMVEHLQDAGYESTPYVDRNWK